MTLTIPKPLDMHVHLRQDDLLRTVTRWTARHFSKALVMPNLTPPVCSANDVSLYRQDIIVAAGSDSPFEPLMTFKILPDTDPSILEGLERAGAIAGKVYPKGLTTNAEDGVEDYFALHGVFARMEKLGLVLCLHGEKPGVGIEGLDRERAFLRTLFYLARTFPKLRIVMEHITTAAAVDAVLQLPDTVAATITVHHLILTHDDVGGDRMRPHHYCKPVAKFAADREALVEAAMSGCPKFFFGSDSAPHLRSRKECDECCAGIFTAPVTLPLLAEIFEQHDALKRFQNSPTMLPCASMGCPRAHRLIRRRSCWRNSRCPCRKRLTVSYHSSLENNCHGASRNRLRGLCPEPAFLHLYDEPPLQTSQHSTNRAACRQLVFTQS